MKSYVIITTLFALWILFSTNMGIAEQYQSKNSYDTDLSITHMDISLKTDFQSNKVDAVVKATVENLSQNAVNDVRFWLCPGWNEPNFGTNVRKIYFIDGSVKKELQFTIHTNKDEKYFKGNIWESYHANFPKSIRRREKVMLQFEYTMKGNSDHSSTPIEQSKDGIKELYLRGGDFAWFPILYYEVGTSPKLFRPTWTLQLECPNGYVGVTNGTLQVRDDNDGWVIDKWQSLKPGYPYLYASQYEVLKRTIGDITFELYVSDEDILRETAEMLNKYARIYELYSELFGNPEYLSYRIVGSPISGVGASFDTGFMTDQSRLLDIHHIAHEMAHTWWGGMLSTYGVGSQFLSESLAEFSARWILCVMDEKHESHNSLCNGNILIHKQIHFCAYFPITDSYPQSWWKPLISRDGKETASEYHWGPLVVNQIRLIIGDEVFFKSLSSFVAKYRGNQVGIDEFIETINEISESDIDSDLKGMLFSTGFASYRLLHFDSVKKQEHYQTRVTIQNQGDFGLTCPLLLKTVGGEERRTFKVEAGQNQEFIFTTPFRVIDVVIDADSLTLLQYHPRQKIRLWKAMLDAIESYGNNEAYGKSFMYYTLGEFNKAVEVISKYLNDRKMHLKVEKIEKMLNDYPFYAQYVFMRGIFYLMNNDLPHAQENINNAFPYMLQVMINEDIIRVPISYYEVGAIQNKELNEYLNLLSLIAGRTFSFEPNMSEEAKIQKIEEWQQWWEKEGKHQKLSLISLKKRFELYRQEFRDSIEIDD